MEQILFGMLMVTPLFVGIIFMLFGTWLNFLYSSRQLLGIIGIVLSIPFFMLYWIETKRYYAIAIVVFFLLSYIKNFFKDKNIERQLIFIINEQTNNFNNYNISIQKHLSNINEEPERIKKMIMLLSSKGLISHNINISE